MYSGVDEVCINMGFSVSKLYRRKNMNVLMHGLDAAGKTTILYKLKLGEVTTTIPTIGFHVESVSHKKLTLTAIDVGGRCAIRPLYRYYYQDIDAIVFVIDSDDRFHMSEVKDEFERLVNEDLLKDVVVLVLANKQDLPGSMTVQEVAEEIDFHHLARFHRMNILGCSATTGEGLFESFDWLSQEMSTRPRVSLHPPQEKISKHPERPSKLPEKTWPTYLQRPLATLKTLLSNLG